MPTYARLPISFQKGNGVWLQDSHGGKYLDALSGIGVMGLGHSHPEITKTICQQAENLIHTSNVYQIEQQQKLADKLIEVSGMVNCFFGNSGAEANEAAIKITRLFAKEKKIANPSIIVFENAFHGRTMATLSATANPKVQAGFEPLLPGFIRAPFNDLDAIKALSENNADIVGILMEPVQGEGGINIANKNFVQGLRKLCDEKDYLLIFDEVQSGNGRTGKYFAYEHFGIKPDILTTAKALGNGLPISVCIADQKAATIFAAGNHGSTYGGNQLSCASALSTVNIISQAKFLDHIQAMSEYFNRQFQEKLADIKVVSQLKILGLMIGIELTVDAPDLVSAALEKGLLINVTAGNVVRLLPPLIINEEEIDFIIKTLRELLSKL